MNRHKWQLQSVSIGISPFDEIDAKNTKKIFCSSSRKQPPTVGRYNCERCGSFAKVLRVLKCERFNQRGYEYRVTLNWTENCDEALVVNVCKA